MRKAASSVTAAMFLGVALAGALIHVTPGPLVAQRPPCTADEGKICRLEVNCPAGGDCTTTALHFEEEE